MDEWLLQAFEDIEQGRAALVEVTMRQRQAEVPTSVPVMEVLGMALARQGKLEEARSWFVRATKLEPDSPSAWVNLGNICLECNDPADAASAFCEARTLGATGVAWMLGYGLALMGLARFVEARHHLELALAEEPSAVDVRLAYAQCLAELEEFDALGRCLDALSGNALNLAHRQALAWLLAQAGRDMAAQHIYRELLRESPGSAQTRVQFALLLERLNCLDEAEQVLKGLDRSHEAEVAGMFELAAARLLRRRQRPEEAIAHLAVGLQHALPVAMQAQLQFERARNHDALGQVGQAFNALGLAHAAAGKAFAQRSSGTRAADVLGWLQQRLRNPAPDTWQVEGTRERLQSPVFLVGFPRSGTTLLERMLDVHSQLDVLDERPALEVAIEQLRRLPGWEDHDLDGSLHSIGAKEIADATRAYWKEVWRHVGAGGRLVDKYPLTMTRLPYAARLFPNADWLLLLRHPCDCVLSCYMQAFGSNGGAMAFASLESTARTYVAIMGWWHEQRALLPVRVHTLRYEDLVQDLPGQLGQLMDFLALPLEPAQLAFDRHAAQRASRINTPSYSQVVQPLNARAVGRWRAYREHFGPEVLAILEPWVERLGYTLD